MAGLLVPVDFSEASTRAVTLAAMVAARFHARIHLLYAVEPPALPEWGYFHLAVREQRLRLQAEQRLARLPDECGVDARWIASADVRSGSADVEICGHATRHGVDLIAMATHGLGRWPGVLIGSTAERVVRHARCPVLLLPATAKPAEPGLPITFAPRRILVCTDFSVAAARAFPCATVWARAYGSSLHLLHVVPSHLPGDVSHLGIVLEENRLLEEARARLPEVRDAQLPPALDTELSVLNGGPAHEICRCAATLPADLIILASHGHSVFRSFVLGSVTDRVIRHAPCPVLVVPGGL